MLKKVIFWKSIYLRSDDVIRQIFEMVWELVDKDKENYVRFSSEDKK
jgi:hypothetical protein